MLITFTLPSRPQKTHSHPTYTAMPIIDIKGYNDFAAIASMNETAHQVNIVTNPDNLMYLTCVYIYRHFIWHII